MPGMTRRELLLGAGTLLAGTRVAGLRAQAPADWQPLFDGSSLGLWESTSFGGEGKVHVRDGMIVLEFGHPLTGITWTGEHPTMSYEIALEAIRLSGNDFYCGLTFPVGQDFCSFILGGWGGGTVGLSSLDGMDASENETSRAMRLEDNRWYAVRVRVVPGRLQVWLDDARIVNVDTEGRRIGIRPEVDPSRPLGIASYRTRAGLRAIRLRPVTGE